jgi:hypothetical protein
MLLRVVTFNVLIQRVWVNVVKHFTVVIYAWAEYARVQALQALSDICLIYSLHYRGAVDSCLICKHYVDLNGKAFPAYSNVCV